MEKGERSTVVFFLSVLFLALLATVLLPSGRQSRGETAYCAAWDLGTAHALKEIEVRGLELGEKVAIEKCLEPPTDDDTLEALCDGFTNGYKVLMVKVAAPSYLDFQIKYIEWCFNRSRSIWF